MAHIEPNIDVTVPADGDLASLGDDSIRQYKRQLLERLLDVIEDVTADPWVLKAGVVGVDTIPDGGITAPKLAPVLKLRSILLTTVAINATLTFPHGISVQTITVPGAAVGDTVLLAWAGAAQTFVHMHAWVSAPNTVTLTLGNDSDSSTIVMTGDQLTFIVIKPALLTA